MRAAFLDWGSVDANDLDPGCLTDLPMQWDFYPLVTQHELNDLLVDTDILVTNKVVLSNDHIEQAQQLKLICVAATGTNNIDLQSTAARQIPVCNVTGYATDSVVQHVFMLLLNLVRQTPAYQYALQQGRWQGSEHFSFLDYGIESLSGKTMGIIGYGELGQAVARMAEQFAMQVQIAQRLHGDAVSGRVPLKTLLQQADVISLHCPLTEQTRNLIGERELRCMKPTAILINTARGGIVDEDALLRALDQRQIAAAGLDVLATEPPAENHPLLRQQRTDLIITPHIAWASRQARQKLIAGIANNIQSWLNGVVSNRVG